MRIENLLFAFNMHDTKNFFDNLSIEFKPQVLNFITGENGIGKSTLFAALQGVVSSHARYKMKVKLNGATYSSSDNTMSDEYTSVVRVVQQQYDRMLADRFSFIENLRCANIGAHPKLQRLPEAKMFEIVKRLGIDIHAPVYTLSGGQRQMLAICMALQKRTKLLLLDEPTATLDPQNAQMVMACLQQLAKKLQLTVVIICHDQEMVKQYGENSIVKMYKKDDGTRAVMECVHDGS